ncbi:MAG: ABC transporter ATP-binding protein/permease [bacterium]|nr:ABC transporter ATP-binding protein/permease [bacterium]
MSLQRETLKIYWQHAWRYKPYVIGIFLTLPLALVMHQILPPIIAASILDRLSTGNFVQGELWESFGVPLLAYGLLVILGGSLGWRLAVYFIWKLESFVERDLARTVFNKYMDLDSEFHANSFGGSLVSRANKLLSSYIRLADTAFFQLYTLIVFFIISSAVLWSRSPQFVIVSLFVSIIYIASSVLITKKVRQLSAVQAERQNKQTGVLADMVTNIMAVKSFAAHQSEKKRYEKSTESSRKATNDVMRASLLTETYFGGVTTSLQTLALVLATASVVLFDANIGTVFLILTYTGNIQARLWDFSMHSLRQINRGLGDAQEAVETLLREPEVLDPIQPKRLHLQKGEITFEEVSFSHDHTNLFEHFNLRIAPGEKIGIVGLSGSGKTTLTKLLLRFKDLNSGKILVDGTDISSVAQADLRSYISYVPQEPLLFHRSLSENIAYGKGDSNESEIIKAAKNAHAHEFITKLPESYKTLVGERGVKLSGGQRQRVAIARAMLKDAPILILDEATSALDSESEVLIQDALWKLMEGRTAIVIAHRLSTIQKMDRIIVLDDGKIVEEGSHKQLIANKGVYSRLWQHQSGGFLED